jgi:hypothetical protein
MKYLMFMYPQMVQESVFSYIHASDEGKEGRSGDARMNCIEEI